MYLTSLDIVERPCETTFDPRLKKDFRLDNYFFQWSICHSCRGSIYIYTYDLHLIVNRDAFALSIEFHLR